MAAALLLFPHQLFQELPSATKKLPVILVEEFLFFKQYRFHKQKLVFHRASMKAYQHSLEEKGMRVQYIEATQEICDVRLLIPHLRQQGITELHYCDVTDNWLEKRIREHAKETGIELTQHPSPLFLLNKEQVDAYFTGKKKYFQTDFYIQQRKRFQILVDKDQPVGDKWSFDAENRLKYPKGKKAPKVSFPTPNIYWKEATQYVETHFASNYGSINQQFIYPTTASESEAWLKQFLKKRFDSFGEYEDALVTSENILNHSVLTPMLNVGLLTPRQIIDQAIAYADKKEIPLNSLEGFIRQIIGWREFIRGVYEHKGTYERTKNYWKFTRKIPPSFWNGTTGIAPIDSTIRKVLETGYCHHIERLMVLGNFMLLCEFDPDEVYQWFMELFIDAYDWVMVPNVYGMSQFADGGWMATKPYISGSNYLMKMSDYPKGDWQPVWDALFWRFMHLHRDFFLKNPRLGMLVKTFDKMPEEKRSTHLLIADKFLTGLEN
ncbi:MAG: cryptochrome/photolyase family protein [Bacteroidetes bacterium]|nr:cryptochrome/photolyase family protein [Bacteroidota bacterium]